jgi:threonine/homoserine/homoserine lactone efflux protein
MKVLMKVVSVVFVAVAAFLIYAVIAALASAGGARPAVAIGYAVGAAILTYVAVWMWRKSARRPVEAAGPAGPAM